MQKTVTVIGGSGFIGRATVEMLARAKMRVIVLCRNAERAKYLKPLGNVGQITLVSGDALCLIHIRRFPRSTPCRSR